LILLKLFALPSLYRQFDYDRVAIYEGDVLQLLARTSSSDEELLAVLRSHIELDSDIEQLGNILQELRAKLKRIRRSE
jgi:hypothetical protein